MPATVLRELLHVSRALGTFSGGVWIGLIRVVGKLRAAGTAESSITRQAIDMFMTRMFISLPSKEAQMVSIEG